MSGNGGGSVELTVEGAHKRDAGRGIARLPESVRSELGVLSGSPVIIEGEGATVVKVWPGEGDGSTVRIDSDTRANAGVNIGDTVRVRAGSVTEATDISIQPLEPLPGTDEYAHMVRTRLVDQMVQAGERTHIDGLGAFVVRSTEPDGAVRVAPGTDVTVLPSIDEPADEGDSGAAGGTTAATPAAPAETATGVSYEDIGGLDEELDRIREMIEMPLAEPERFRELGIDPPSGVLMHGPPGTGKTLIAKAVANEVDAYFDTISGPEIVSKYKGESEERLREAFERAEENSPAILFVDEIDSIAGSRDEDADMENRVVAQLLTLMDGLEDRGRVVVIGATNRVDAVDQALRRGGRFDREIEIGVPDEGGRREILDVHTREMPLADDVDLDRIAAQTHGFVGADLASLTTEAAMSSLRAGRERTTSSDDESEDAANEGPAVTQSDFDAALAVVDPSAMREYVAESPAVSFDDVGGLDEVKQTLTEAIEWPLSYGELFAATNTDPPSGILLYGPPGTGKTLLARAVAGESDVNFIHVAGPEIMDRYVGESEEAVRELFERARQTAPSIIFLDEIDAIASHRGQGNEVTERVVSQLLAELDGITENPNLVVLAATNRRDMIDDALLRPGRLEQHVEVPNPDAAAREEILSVHTRGKPLTGDVSVAELAADLEGYSGAELEAVVREASMLAIREMADELGPAEASERADEVRITGDHFRRAIERAADR
ncbi:CDC48 family AAA ATPase [Haloarcula onubensis]|uniref:CDC48 family AAA ATPase n=1 Tax=Haloarcula onubensis TaxID=2950539 RepID=A0ABU2FQW1_9EURY|nr:CDC48 family AAA ATPase [Halomicroarcula sp. S3CR25-11]MDS0283155.1 CDC48 family AAA ATPase [Halomicroarcula sp. S3CR25-11]